MIPVADQRRHIAHTAVDEAQRHIARIPLPVGADGQTTHQLALAIARVETEIAELRVRVEAAFGRPRIAQDHTSTAAARTVLQHMDDTGFGAAR